MIPKAKFVSSCFVVLLKKRIYDICYALDIKISLVTAEDTRALVYDWEILFREFLRMATPTRSCRS